MGVVMIKKSIYRLSGYRPYLVKAYSLQEAFSIAEERGHIVFSGQYVTNAEAAKIAKEPAFNNTIAMVLT